MCEGQCSGAPPATCIGRENGLVDARREYMRRACAYIGVPGLVHVHRVHVIVFQGALRGSMCVYTSTLAVR